MYPSRNQMYSLITAFERDIRDMIHRFIVAEVHETELLGSFAENAIQKRDRDLNNDEISLIEYLDLRTEYDLLNSYHQFLPTVLANEVREATKALDVIVPIRHRVMHGRPLRHQDPESLLSHLQMFKAPYWNHLKITLNQFNKNELLDNEEYLKVKTDDRVLNNLPIAEYEDTGLLGREDEINSIFKLIQSGRERVITLTGEGGIGKTALAIEVLSRLLDDPLCPFDAILWVDLKTERLTSSGILEIKSVANNLIGALSEAASIFAGDFYGELSELSETLEGLNTLICVDNLESISGHEFVTMYDYLPQSTTYLVTSRKGIGQLERRINVSPLPKKDSLILLNQLIGTRNIESLRTVEKLGRIHITEQLRHSPLAIRWFIHGCEAGLSPEQLLKNQDDLVEYCVRSVYDLLSLTANQILTALYVVKRSLTVDDLVILLSIDVDELQTGLIELVQGSLVKFETTMQLDIKTTVSISETANAFLSKKSNEFEVLAQRIKTNENELKRQEANRIKEESKRSLSPKVVRLRQETDKPIAMILRKALMASRKGKQHEADTLVSQALQLDNSFWEIYRVQAFFASERGQMEEASAKYLDSYQLATSAEHKAIVAHFFAGHLARRVKDTSKAIEYAREANLVFNNAETLHALGNYLNWIRSFAEAKSLLYEALNKADGQLRIMIQTSLARTLHNEAEHTLEEEKNILRAWDLSLKAFRFASRPILEGVYDRKLIHETVDAIFVCLKVHLRSQALLEKLNEVEVFQNELTSVLGRLSLDESFKPLLAKLQRAGGEFGNIAGEYADSQFDELIQLSEFGEYRFGFIVTIGENFKYGFIDRYDSANIFFHPHKVQNIDWKDLQLGAKVWFRVGENRDGQSIAEDVWVGENAPKLEDLEKIRSATHKLLTADKHIECWIESHIDSGGNRRMVAISKALPRIEIHISPRLIVEGKLLKEIPDETTIWLVPKLKADKSVKALNVCLLPPLSEDGLRQILHKGETCIGTVQSLIRNSDSGELLYIFVTLRIAPGHSWFVHASEISELDKLKIVEGVGILVKPGEDKLGRLMGTQLKIIL